MMLAECPERVDAGNPYRPDATITVVERYFIAEEACESCSRQAKQLEELEGSVPSPLTIDLMTDANIYRRLMDRCRAHPRWQPTVDWIGVALALMVRGDPARGIPGDPCLLCYVQGS